MLKTDTSHCSVCPLRAETELSIYRTWMEMHLLVVDICTDMKDFIWPLVSPNSQLQIS